jgi:hypothetical protein
MSFALLQRLCSCTARNPLCCFGGSVITYVGSRFILSAVVSDDFEPAGKHYLLFWDGYSNWISVYRASSHETSELITERRGYVSTICMIDATPTDEKSAHISKEFRNSLARYDTSYRIPNVHN